MWKWNIKNWIIAVSIFIIYSLTWHLGWQLSVNFETIADITSWFLPAGIRVASLLLINKKYWPVIALAEFSDIYSINNVDNPYSSLLGMAIGTFLPMIIYMVVVHLFLKTSNRVSFDSVKNVIKLFSWASLGASLTAIVLVTSLMLQGQLEHDKLLTTIFLFMLGDFVGILLLVPLAVAIKTLFDTKFSFQNVKQFFSWPNFIFVAISMLIAYLLVQQSMVYYIKLFAFIPIIIFAYRNGWLGATFSIFIVNIIIVMASLITSDLGTMLEKQLYLIAISMTGLLLGAAISEQRLLNTSIVRKNDELLSANNQLLSLSNKNQRLAQKIVDIQEDERKNLSRELHDEIGQNITALKLHLNVIKQMTKSDSILPIIESIDNIANITYESAYDLMHSLRPRILDELGLEVALTASSINQHLESANIIYTPYLEGKLNLLTDQFKIAIYRIAQECINNTIKYAKAKQLWLKLVVDGNNLVLEIKDDGIGFDTSVKNRQSSFGLQGIEDRVTALGGEYKLSTSSEGTVHSVAFTIKPNISV